MCFSISSYYNGTKDYKAVFRSDTGIEVWFDQQSKFKTHIEGKIKIQKWNELLDLIRISSIYEMSPNQYYDTDGPYFWIKIYVKNEAPHLASGPMRLYPLRVQNLVLSLDETIKTLNLD